MDHISSQRTIWLLSVVTVAIHVAALAAGEYGYFRDELYYIACANHPDIGYVDHPPLSIWILAGWKFICGDSLFSLRLLPALCAGVTTLIVGIITQRLGGTTFAVLLAGFSTMLAPIFLAFFGLFTMNAFDLLFWALACLVILRIAVSEDSRWWYVLGLIIGLGALNKISMLWLAAGVAVGILLTTRRRSLRSPAPWIAGLLAVILFLPFIIWNVNHGFAHIEFIQNASTQKYASQNPLTFFGGLLMIMNPLSAPIWIAGAWFLFARKDYRLIGITVAAVLAILILNVHSKPEYFAGAMTVVLAAGSVQIERLLQRAPIRWARGIYLTALIGLGIVLLPVTLDVLPVESYVRYQTFLGIPSPSTEGQQLSELPQHFADRFGWENMAEVVGSAYASLPDSDKAKCLIYGRNYGEASAIDFFGRRFGLPPAISRHNSYWYWSMDHLREDMTLIAVGVRAEDMAELFGHVEESDFVRSKYVMPYENNLPVLICRNPRRSAREFWYQHKLFI